MGIRCADHVTPLYPQKLALPSPTDSGRSVGVVRSRTKATEFSLVFNLGVRNQMVRLCLGVSIVGKQTGRYVREVNRGILGALHSGTDLCSVLKTS